MREYVDSVEDVSVNTVRCPEKLGSNITRRPKAGGWYCTPISKDEDRIHRYVRARVNAFTLLYREDLVTFYCSFADSFLLFIQFCRCIGQYICKTIRKISYMVLQTYWPIRLQNRIKNFHMVLQTYWHPVFSFTIVSPYMHP